MTINNNIWVFPPAANACAHDVARHLHTYLLWATLAILILQIHTWIRALAISSSQAFHFHAHVVVSKFSNFFLPISQCGFWSCNWIFMKLKLMVFAPKWRLFSKFFTANILFWEHLGVICFRPKTKGFFLGKRTSYIFLWTRDSQCQNSANSLAENTPNKCLKKFQPNLSAQAHKLKFFEKKLSGCP